MLQECATTSGFFFTDLLDREMILHLGGFWLVEGPGRTAAQGGRGQGRKEMEELNAADHGSWEISVHCRIWLNMAPVST